MHNYRRMIRYQCFEFAGLRRSTRDIGSCLAERAFPGSRERRPIERDVAHFSTIIPLLIVTIGNWRQSAVWRHTSWQVQHWWELEVDIEVSYGESSQIEQSSLKANYASTGSTHFCQGRTLDPNRLPGM